MTFFGKNSHLSYMNLFYICIVKQKKLSLTSERNVSPKSRNISRLIFCGIFLMMWVGVERTSAPFFLHTDVR